MTDELDLRASDAERERVAASLREHCAAGRLTLEELSERLDEAYRARTMIWTFAVLGGADIYVPEGVEVDAAGFALLGGVDEHGADVPPRPGSPLVRVRSLALLGGADIWRVPPGAPAELSPGGTGS